MATTPVFTSREDASTYIDSAFTSGSWDSGAFILETEDYDGSYSYGSGLGASNSFFAQLEDGNQGLAYYTYGGTGEYDVFYAADTSDMLYKAQSEGYTGMAAGGLVYESDGPTAKDFQAINPATGDNLIISEGSVVGGLSFGTIYSELVKTNEYLDHTFTSEDFEVTNVQINAVTYAADEAGITVDSVGEIKIDATSTLYDLADGETTEVKVGFEVTDPNDRTDQGSITFAVAGVGDGISDSDSDIDDKSVNISTELNRVKDLEDITALTGSQSLNKSITEDTKADYDAITSNNSSANVFIDGKSLSGGDNYYVLNVNAETAGDYNLNSFDFSIGYESEFFKVVDVGVNGNFDLFNSIKVDTDEDSIRIVGGSADEISAGKGILNGTKGNTLQILLQGKHDENASNEENSKDETEFTATVNSTDTTLVNANDDGDIHRADANTFKDTYSVEHSFVALEFESDIDLVTERKIGGNSFTNLVRSGDTIKALGTLDISNEGNVNGDYTIDIVNNAADDFVLSFDVAGIGTNQVTGTGEHDGIADELQLQMEVTGGAGEIIDHSEASITATNTLYGVNASETLVGKNLITYQSDISYDGRVSMTDLAYLNAGAGRDGYARDVDVNYDEVINIDDLAKMDAEWGSSLHSLANNLSDNANVFTGKHSTDENPSTIDLNSGDLNSDSTLKTNNEDFINQNEYELTTNFVGTLAEPSLAGYTNPNTNTSEDETGKLNAVLGSDELPTG